MKSILLLILFTWISAGVGRILLDRLTVLTNYSLERFAFGTAIGLLLASYGVFALGMLGALSFWPITIWWITLAVIGIKAQWLLIKDLQSAIRTRTSIPPTKSYQIIRVSCLLVIIFFAFVAIVACFRPPGGHEWDAIAYHLADVKIFLANHRISSLPTEHHSNFPFTMEMLFAVGLLYDGYVLANLFHFLMAALTVCALIAAGSRLFGKPAGCISALLFATTPLVLWEASTAYIDLGFGLFSFLAAVAVISSVKSDPKNKFTSATQTEWAVLAGISMGGALGMKYLALIPLIIYGGFLLSQRVPIKTAAIFFGLALTIGSPWYIKNIVLTQNPVYPFMFKIFHNSKYWSTDRAIPYQAEQDSFGYVHSLHAPAETVRNIIQTPWRLLANADKFANHGDFTFSVLIGGIFTGLCFSLIFMRKIERSAMLLLRLGILQLLAWFFLAQIGRYLVSLVPILALVSAYAASRWLKPELEPSQSPGWQPRLLQIFSAIVLSGQALLTIWAVLSLPTSGRAAAERGVMPTVISLPEDLAVLSDPDKRAEQLRRTLDIYAAMEWINTKTPASSGVILYDDARGYYLDRPYLWGNGEHSAYIPYTSMHNGADLTRWLLDHGIQTVLINLKFSPNNKPSDDLPNGPSHSESIALQKWVIDSVFPNGSWRAILSDALRTQNWKVQFEGNGVVVLSIPSSPS